MFLTYLCVSGYRINKKRHDVVTTGQQKGVINV